MKTKILLLLALITLSGCASMVSRWEYKVVFIDPFANGLFAADLKTVNKELLKRQNTILNELGAKGWELMRIEGNQYFFKRPGKLKLSNPLAQDSN